MKIISFKDIFAWQKARILTKQIYTHFSTNKDYSFKDQIQRASVSIMNNIAEGFDRRGSKEFKRFLYISKGSCAEVQSMLYTALDLGYISEDIFISWNNLAQDIARILSGLIKKLN